MSEIEKFLQTLHDENEIDFALQLFDDKTILFLPEIYKNRKSKLKLLQFSS